MYHIDLEISRSRVRDFQRTADQQRLANAAIRENQKAREAGSQTAYPERNPLHVLRRLMDHNDKPMTPRRQN